MQTFRIYLRRISVNKRPNHKQTNFNQPSLFYGALIKWAPRKIFDTILKILNLFHINSNISLHSLPLWLTILNNKKSVPEKIATDLIWPKNKKIFTHQGLVLHRQESKRREITLKNHCTTCRGGLCGWKLQSVWILPRKKRQWLR